MKSVPTLLLCVLGLLASIGSAQAEPGPVVLRFGDFFAAPIGPRGPQPSAALLAASGQRVQIIGYMVAQELPSPGQFLLTPRPLHMSEHADGDADDLPAATVVVLLPEAERERVPLPTHGLLQLTGRLNVGREEMADGRISWVRLLLEPQPPTAPGPTAP
jgi:hypothetical protein